MGYLTSHFPYVLAVATLAAIFSVLMYQLRFKLQSRKQGSSGRISSPPNGEIPGTGVREPTYTYDDLARNIVRSTLSLFPTSMAAVYLFDVDRREYCLRAQQGMSSSLAKDLLYHTADFSIAADDPLIRFIGSSRDLVTKESVASRSTMVEIQKDVLETLSRTEAQVCAPFLYTGQVKGLLVCGAKADGFPYTPEELIAIQAFARMGDEIVRYLSGMEAELNYTSLYAHDMNNDTKSLVQTLQFLQSPMASDAPREKIVQLLKQAEDVATRLNQSFELTSFRTGLVMKSIWGHYEKIPTDIGKCVQLACEKHQQSCLKKNISLKTRIPESPIIVNGNAHDLTRIFENLLINASRYVDQGGIIEVLCEETPGTFEAIVRDNGRYTDPIDVERIWSLGWQAKNSHHGASGFRLSIARQIVHLHQGRIQIAAQSGENGTLFRISIPLMEGPFPAKMEASQKRRFDEPPQDAHR